VGFISTHQAPGKEGLIVGVLLHMKLLLCKAHKKTIRVILSFVVDYHPKNTFGYY